MTPSTDLIVVDPRDGTILDSLADQKPDLLAEVALELRRREQQLHDMRELVEAELTDRVLADNDKDRRVAITVLDDYELRVERARSRRWDGDDLEATLEQLHQQGVLRAGEWTGLVTREPKVDGKAAQRLLGQLSGQSLAAVEACFEWEHKGRPRLTITPCPSPFPEGQTDAVQLRP